MFEASLLNILAADGALAGYLSTYDGAPAIFSESVPEKAELPYLTFSISRFSTDNTAVEAFNIFVDYFDSKKSRANSRKAVQRVEFILDETIITGDARYGYIRLFYENGSPVPGMDPRDAHYNLQFLARAGRKAWANQL